MTGDPRLLVPALGLGYVAVFGLMFWVRREGFQVKFTVEGLVITLIGTILAFYGLVGPILFLVVLYLITMRSRVLADAGNYLSGNGHFREALLMFDIGEKTWPDAVSRFMLSINKGVALFRMGAVGKAIETLEAALEKTDVAVPAKHLAACHYNLGIAYRRAGEIEASRWHFLKVLDIDPDSIYAIGARTGLRKLSEQSKSAEEDSEGRP